MRVRAKAISKDGEIQRSTLWLPQVDKIRAGDVLFTRHVYGRSVRNVWQSKAIRKKTKGLFSHVAICITPPVFIEAIGQGVSNISMTRVFAFDRDNIRMRRYHDAGVAAKAGSWASPMLGQHYSRRKAAATQFPAWAAVTDLGTICSRLVFDAFAAAGASELEGLDASRITPATLDELPSFADVTDDIFLEKLTPRNAEKMSALDGDYVPSPADENTAILATYIEQVWPQLKTLGELSPVFQVPRAFLEAIESIGSLLLIAADRRDNPALTKMLQEVDRSMAACIARGDLARVAAEAYKLESDDLARMEREVHEIEPDIDVDQLRQVIGTRHGILAARKNKLVTLRNMAAVSEAAALVHKIQSLQAEQTAEGIARRESVLKALE